MSSFWMASWNKHAISEHNYAILLIIPIFSLFRLA